MKIIELFEISVAEEATTCEQNFEAKIDDNESVCKWGFNVLF